MTKGLSYTVDVHGQWSIYYLQGSIGDSAEAVFDEIISRAPNHVIFDFTKIIGINSTGIADWLDFLEKLASNRQIIFDNCSPPVVDVLNMINGFYKGASIRSVLLPYSCAKCAKDWMHQLNVQEELDADNLIVRCPTCQTTGKVGVDLEDHLFFRNAN